MSDARVLAQQANVQRVSDGTWTNLRALRDGAVIVVPWYQALVLEGRCFSATSPATFSVTGTALATSFATDESFMMVDIPDGTAAFPLVIEVAFLATGAAVGHAAGMVTTAIHGTASVTEVDELNLRLDNPISSGATAGFTNNSGVAVIDGTERVLFHFATNQDLDAVDIDPQRRWTVAEAGVTPVTLDAGGINVIGTNGTSGTAFGLVQWCELPESAIT